jgi:hypothetical protein
MTLIALMARQQARADPRLSFLAAPIDAPHHRALIRRSLRLRLSLHLLRDIGADDG